jgi:hypothetical protein
MTYSDARDREWPRPACKRGNITTSKGAVMSYSLKIYRDEAGDFKVSSFGDVPEGSFYISGHHQPGHSDEITVSHQNAHDERTVRGGGYANHVHAIRHHEDSKTQKPKDMEIVDVEEDL